MAERGYPTCPICEAEMPLGGDEKAGDSAYCSVCQAELRLKKVKGKDSSSSSGEDFYLEEE